MQIYHTHETLALDQSSCSDMGDRMPTHTNLLIKIDTSSLRLRLSPLLIQQSACWDHCKQEIPISPSPSSIIILIMRHWTSQAAMIWDRIPTHTILVMEIWAIGYWSLRLSSLMTHKSQLIAIGTP